MRKCKALVILLVVSIGFSANAEGCDEKNSVLDDVTILNITGCGKTDFIFKGFEGYQDTVEIFASHNNITVLRNCRFQNFFKVTLLNLSNNEISIIGEKAFGGLEALQTLDLSSNKVKFLMDSFFEASKNLNSINLEHNVVLSVEKKLMERTVDGKQIELKFSEGSCQIPRKDGPPSCDVLYERNLNTYKQIDMKFSIKQCNETSIDDEEEEDAHEEKFEMWWAVVLGCETVLLLLLCGFLFCGSKDSM